MKLRGLLLVGFAAVLTLSSAMAEEFESIECRFKDTRGKGARVCRASIELCPGIMAKDTTVMQNCETPYVVHCDGEDNFEGHFTLISIAVGEDGLGSTAILAREESESFRPSIVWDRALFPGDYTTKAMLKFSDFDALLGVCKVPDTDTGANGDGGASAGGPGQF